MSEETDALHWALAGPDWPDGAVTRKTVRALVAAALPDSNLGWMRAAIRRIDASESDLIERSGYVIRVKNRARLRAPQMTTTQILLAIWTIEAYVRHDCFNAMLAARMTVEANHLRRMIGADNNEGEENPMAANGNRDILGPPNNTAPQSNYPSGGNDSMSARPPYGAPSGTTDQTSPQTAAERNSTESRYHAAHAAANAVTSVGQGGLVVAPAGHVATSADGAANLANSGPGMSI